jgi:histone acetyltransferase 1
MTGTADDKELIAGLSAASACIRLSLDEQFELSFRPVFTHQFFPDECLPGWRPLSDAERQAQLSYQSWKSADDSDELHASFGKCQLGKDNCGRIDIHVLLTPSCMGCDVEIQTIELDEKGENDEPISKKAKTVRFDQPKSNPEQRMALNDILKQLSSAVPPVSRVRLNGTNFDGLNSDKITAACQYLDQPIGSIMKSYSRKIKDTSNEANFTISIAPGTDEEASRYHNSVQKLAKWFIETADDVDISGKLNDGDADGGFWSVLYLFREHNVLGDNEQRKVQYSLAGYITLFHFHAPFRKPEPGIVVRVCQALILPPYQRAGHGSEMLKSVYEYADEYTSNGMKIVEVNVEDPAPGFVALRDFVDYHRFLDSLANNVASEQTNKDLTEIDGDFFSPTSEDELQRVASLLKVTKRQAHIVHEMYKLAQLETWKKTFSDACTTENRSLIQDKETQFRLMIKKALRSLRKEELGACDTKDEQKALLERWFQMSLLHYRTLLNLKVSYDKK